MDAVGMDADLLVRPYGYTVANGDHNLVAFCDDNRRAWNRGFDVVAGSDISAIDGVLNHPVGQQTIGDLFRGHLNPVIRANAFPNG
jgi:hypothetical protein